MKISLWLIPLCFALVLVGCNEASPPAAGPAPQGGVAGGGGAAAAGAATGRADPRKSVRRPHQEGNRRERNGEGHPGHAGERLLAHPDRTIFLNLQHAMDLYKGEHGALPKTHDDFMRDIIQANNIKLPELPDDSRYVYMPDKEELMIERRPM